MKKIPLAIKSALFLSAALALPGAAHATVPTYKLIWLGFGNTSGATDSFANNINNAGQIIGEVDKFSPTALTWGHSAIWDLSGKLVKELPNSSYQPCIGVATPCSDSNGSIAINDNGLMVGVATIDQWTNVYHSYFYDSTLTNSIMQPITIPADVSLGYEEGVSDINNLGVAVGFTSSASSYFSNAYTYTVGQSQVNLLPLPSLADGTQAEGIYPQAINDNGIIVGDGAKSIPGSPGRLAYTSIVWQNGVGREIAGFSLAQDNPDGSRAMNVNNAGQIIGSTSTPRDAQGNAWPFARLHDLSSGNTVSIMTGDAVGINTGGAVVGHIISTLYPFGPYVFLPSSPNAQSGHACNLDSNLVPALAAAPNDALVYVRAINDSGVIVGQGTHNGKNEGYVLVPTNTPAATPVCNAVGEAPVVVSANLGLGTVGVAYNASVTLSGGAGALSLSASGLPAGLTVSGNTITGIPTEAGSFTVSLTGTDEYGQQTQTDALLDIIAADITVSATLPAGKVGTAYPDTAVNVSGGNGAIDTIVDGLPAGLAYANGIIFGIPTASGTFNVIITSTDSIGNVGTANISLLINPATTTPPSTCTAPKGSVKSDAKSVITAVNGSTISTSAGTTLSVLDCATIQWNRTQHVYKVGDRIEWKGWKDGSVVDATKVTLN